MRIGTGESTPGAGAPGGDRLDDDGDGCDLGGMPPNESDHEARVTWRRGEHPFTGGRYGRGHRWRFDGGAEVAASASPHVVPPPWSDAAAVDPEEALVAAASSCHMLWFLSLAAGRGYVVDAYEDRAVGRIGPDEDGQVRFRRILLRPEVRFGGAPPDAATLAALHREAHERCFIASSLRCPVVVGAPSAGA